MRELFSLPEGYEVALGNGGATAFWDAASFGLIERRALHLAFGEFSQKFATVTSDAPFLGDPLVVKAEPGERARRRGGRGGACAVSTAIGRRDRVGSQRDLDRRDGAGAATRVHGGDATGRLIDATSGAGGLPVDVSQADAYYFAPQKCFAGDGGLWVALLSPASVERIARIEASKRFTPASLSLPIALENSIEGPDLQHAGAGDAVPAGRPDPLDARRRWA